MAAERAGKGRSSSKDADADELQDSIASEPQGEQSENKRMLRGPIPWQEMESKITTRGFDVPLPAASQPQKRTRGCIAVVHRRTKAECIPKNRH